MCVCPVFLFLLRLPAFMMEARLWRAVFEGNVPLVARLLEEHPEVNVNWVNGASFEQEATLHLACKGKSHGAILPLLLRHPEVNVNSLTYFGTSPLRLACQDGNTEAVRHLLAHPRLDVNGSDDSGRSGIWMASSYGHIDIVKLVLASGRAVELHPCENRCTPLEIAKMNRRREVAEVLERFIANPEVTREQLRREVGLDRALAAELFAVVVLLCDDYLRMWYPTRIPQQDHHRRQEGIRRFLRMAMRLPIELQMILCHRVYRSPRETVRGRDVEEAFRKTAAWILTTKPRRQ